MGLTSRYFSRLSSLRPSEWLRPPSRGRPLFGADKKFAAEREGDAIDLEGELQPSAPPEGAARPTSDLLGSSHL